MNHKNRNHPGVIIEFISAGRYVKVNAIDIATHEEVTIVGDPKMGQEHLSALAVQKLRYVQSKR